MSDLFLRGPSSAAEEEVLRAPNTDIMAYLVSLHFTVPIKRAEINVV